MTRNLDRQPQLSLLVLLPEKAEDKLLTDAQSNKVKMGHLASDSLQQVNVLIRTPQQVSVSTDGILPGPL